MGNNKKKKPASPKKKTVTQRYQDEVKKVEKRIKKLSEEGFKFDEKDLPPSKAPRESTIKELKEQYNLRALRRKAYIESDTGERTTSAEVESIKRRQKREEKAVLEIDSMVDSLYDLLDPYYYEKDKKHTSLFTEKAVENMDYLRGVVDELKERISNGEISPEVLKKHIDHIHNLIYKLTQDYVTIFFEYDLHMEELDGVLEDIRFETEDYYDYMNSSDYDE